MADFNGEVIRLEQIFGRAVGKMNAERLPHERGRQISEVGKAA